MRSENLCDALTPTERRVLRHCVDNTPGKTISGQLCLSVETVKTHRKNIARKLGVSGKVAFRRLYQIEREGGLPPTQQLTPTSPHGVRFSVN